MKNKRILTFIKEEIYIIKYHIQELKFDIKKSQSELIDKKRRIKKFRKEVLILNSALKILDSRIL